MVRLEIVRQPRIKEAVVHTADAKPTPPMRLFRMIGNIAPPKELPTMTKPTA